MSSPGSYPTPASEETQEIFSDSQRAKDFSSPRGLLLFIFIFLQNGRKE